MPDRVKVIKALEFTIAESGWDADRAYDEEIMIKSPITTSGFLSATSTTGRGAAGRRDQPMNSERR